jgi:uncharacterized protein YdaL
MLLNIQISINDKLWIADTRYNKPLEFVVDSLNIYEDKNGLQICAHGYRDSGYTNFKLPKSYSLKHFGKRVIFKTKDDANKNLRNIKGKGELI